MYRLSDAAWAFRTARFTVALFATPCEEDPRDQFDDPEDVDAIERGAVEWFDAAVIVFAHVNGRFTEVGADYLGGCAYASVDEFATSHRDPDPLNRNCSIMRAARGDVVVGHYFPDMVREACRIARTHIASMPSLRAA